MKWLEVENYFGELVRFSLENAYYVLSHEISTLTVNWDKSQIWYRHESINFGYSNYLTLTFKCWNCEKMEFSTSFRALNKTLLFQFFYLKLIERKRRSDEVAGQRVPTWSKKDTVSTDKVKIDIFDGELEITISNVDLIKKIKNIFPWNSTRPTHEQVERQGEMNFFHFSENTWSYWAETL
jgi:hypothetical protein